MFSSIRKPTSFVRALFLLVPAALFLSGFVQAGAQTYPSFPNGYKNSYTLHRSSSTVGASPAAWNNFVAFSDASDGTIVVSVLNGQYVSVPPLDRTGFYIGVDNTPALSSLNGTLWLAWIYNNALYTAYSTNSGSNWQGPLQIPLGVTPTGRPALAPIGGSLMLSFRSGNAVYVTVGSGASFGPLTQVASGYVAASNPSLGVYPTGVYFGFLTTGGIPVEGYFDQATPTTPRGTSQVPGIKLAGDPALAFYHGNMLTFGRSYYSDNNLWVIGGGAAEQKYGLTLTNSPAITVSGSGVLCFGRSNYGSELWDYPGY